MRASLKLLVGKPFSASPVKTKSCYCVIQGRKVSTGQQRSHGNPEGVGGLHKDMTCSCEFLLASCRTCCPPPQPCLVHAHAHSLLPTAGSLSCTQAQHPAPCRDAHQDTNMRSVLPSFPTALLASTHTHNHGHLLLSTHTHRHPTLLPHSLQCFTRSQHSHPIF